MFSIIFPVWNKYQIIDYKNVSYLVSFRPTFFVRATTIIYRKKELNMLHTC